MGDARGWCCFENAVSVEVLARLTAYPKMQVVLQALPSKLLSLTNGRQPEVVNLQDIQLDKRIENIVAQIQSATFTGKGDAEKVPGFYREYVERIASKLQSTLAFAASSTPPLQDASGETSFLMPHVQPIARESITLRLAD